MHVVVILISSDHGILRVSQRVSCWQGERTHLWQYVQCHALWDMMVLLLMVVPRSMSMVSLVDLESDVQSVEQEAIAMGLEAQQTA